MIRSSAKCGVLIVDKPKGPTSHDVVAHVRRLFKTRRVGHAGTLDPMATGVLVLLLGEATKLSSVLTREEKSYEATVRFGVGTIAHDADSPIVRRAELPEDWLSRQGDRLAKALDDEGARRLQLPPNVSALKVEGRRAHSLTRAGLTPELSPRDVIVHELQQLRVDGLELDVRLRVSKGYYVRAFARDLGLSLAVPAHLSALRRIQSGAFTLDEAVTLGERGEPKLLPMIEAAKRSLPSLELDEAEAARARQGKLLLIQPERLQEPLGDELLATSGDDLVALLEPLSPAEAQSAFTFLGERERSDCSVLRVKRGFVSNAADFAE